MSNDKCLACFQIKCICEIEINEDDSTESLDEDDVDFEDIDREDMDLFGTLDDMGMDINNMENGE